MDIQQPQQKIKHGDTINHSPKKQSKKTKEPITPFKNGTHVLGQMHCSMLGGQLDCSTYYVVTNTTKTGHTVTLQTLHENGQQYCVKARWNHKNKLYRRNHDNGWHEIIIDTIDPQLEQVALDLLENGPLTKTQIMKTQTPSFCNKQTALFGLNQLVNKGVVFVKTLGIEPTYSKTPFLDSDPNPDPKSNINSNCGGTPEITDSDGSGVLNV